MLKIFIQQICIIYCLIIVIYCEQNLTRNCDKRSTILKNVREASSFWNCNHFKSSENKASKITSVSASWIAAPLTKLLWGFSPDPISDNISGRCARHVNLYKENLANDTLWAIQMLDASTLSPSGIISGDNYQLGHFDQCLDVNVKISKDTIKGQYCLLKISVNPLYTSMPDYYADDFVKDQYSLDYDPLLTSWTKMKMTVDPSKKQRNSIYWATCLPAACSPKEIELSLTRKIVPALAEHGISAKVELNEKLCQVKHSNSYNTLSIIFLGFMATSFLLTVVFSLFDIFYYRISKMALNKNKGKLEMVMLSFSVYENFHNLKRPDRTKELEVIHGMRTLTTILVMFGHRCMFAYGNPFHNPEFLEHRYRSIDEMFVLNGFLIVDTFFVLSGFLTCYLMLKELQKTEFNLLWIYLHRWIRITPLYGIVIGLNAIVLPLIGDGPIWGIKASIESERCQRYWWTNLLFINNYTSYDICMFQSWFLSCDMHFFLFGPVLAYILHKRPKVGVSITSCLLVASIIIPFYIIYNEKLDGVFKLYMSVVEDPLKNDYFKSVYIKSHNRAGPYFFGILTAYILHRLRKIQFKLTYNQVLFGSIFWITVGFGNVLVAWVFYIPDREYNAMENALYASLHRIVWSCAMSWIIITGGTTTFGIVSSVLTLKAFVPLSRLTYPAFLIHGFIQRYTTATIRVSEYVRFPKLFWMWLADVTSSFILGLILHLFYEAPITGLSKIGLMQLYKSKNIGENSVKDDADKQTKKQLNDDIKKLKIYKNQKPKVKHNLSSLVQHCIPLIEKKRM